MDTSATKQPPVEPLTTTHTSSTEDELKQAAKIADEFQYLLEKSQQLFAGLRDLPPTGRWQAYYQRTFEVYTKLWRFQQQHRASLENKDFYGLKRWEIGDMASKIGQLYYHYYLRTSETNYLFESFIFYEAIRERQYFKDVMGSENQQLVIKKLRYYARFIVVCLLLNRNEVLKSLMGELQSLVKEYEAKFNPTDAAEWNVVLSEIQTFVEAEKKLTPTDSQGQLLSVPSRLQIDRTTKFDKDGHVKLKLQEAILVGNYQKQVKFSELTVDMYRILQSLEREPTQGSKTEMKPPIATTTTTEESEDTNKEEQPTRRTNPHKYLLYRPTFSQLMLYIASAFKDVTDNSALLLYLSADGTKKLVKSDSGEIMDSQEPFSGGIATAVSQSASKTEDVSTNMINCLHPQDILPFIRKPLFVIVDSNNSTAFKSIVKPFPQPVAFLLSPTELPSAIKDTTQIGSLFTLFLHSPMKAFAFVSDTAEMSPESWTQCLSIMNDLEGLVYHLLLNSTTLEKSYTRFLQDDFLAKFMVRFIICHSLLSLHKSFKDPKHLPLAVPALPHFATMPEIGRKIVELVTAAGVDALYEKPSE